MCVFLPFILDIKFVGRTSRGHTGGRSHRRPQYSIGCIIISTPQCKRELRPFKLNTFVCWKSVVSRSDSDAEIKTSPHALENIIS